MERQWKLYHLYAIGDDLLPLAAAYGNTFICFRSDGFVRMPFLTVITVQQDYPLIITILSRRTKAQKRGKEVIERLKTVIRRQQFEVILQVCMLV